MLLYKGRSIKQMPEEKARLDQLEKEFNQDMKGAGVLSLLLGVAVYVVVPAVWGMPVNIAISLLSGVIVFGYLRNKLNRRLQWDVNNPREGSQLEH
jgi:uncharacterized membrane protein